MLLFIHRKEKNEKNQSRKYIKHNQEPWSEEHSNGSFQNHGKIIGRNICDSFHHILLFILKIILGRYKVWIFNCDKNYWCCFISMNYLKRGVRGRGRDLLIGINRQIVRQIDIDSNKKKVKDKEIQKV